MLSGTPSRRNVDAASRAAALAQPSRCFLPPVRRRRRQNPVSLLSPTRNVPRQVCLSCSGSVLPLLTPTVGCPAAGRRIVVCGREWTQEDGHCWDRSSTLQRAGARRFYPLGRGPAASPGHDRGRFVPGRSPRPRPKLRCLAGACPSALSTLPVSVCGPCCQSHVAAPTRPGLHLHQADGAGTCSPAEASAGNKSAPVTRPPMRHRPLSRSWQAR